MPDVRILSFHAAYGCRNTGACCTSNWPIPIEVDRYERARAALASGALRPPGSAGDRAFVPGPPNAPGDTAALLATAKGRCVFHDPAGRCAIHSTLGPVALPLACRQFPRVSVMDPRGVSVTLSHYCPTVASLSNDVNTENDEDDRERRFIVVNPAAFPPTAEYVGLDARTALPPLLRPGMLMDWESWWMIESATVDVLQSSSGPVNLALGRVQRAVHRLIQWTPDSGPLATHVSAAFAGAVSPMHVADANLIDLAIAAIPAGSRRDARWSAHVAASATETRRFLAAHAFANWTVHLGDGLWPWWRSVETAAAFIDAGAGVRHADLVLRHLIDPKAFASALSYSAAMKGYR
jgi:Fe-S-cluster containining protein